jgi:Polyketide cyclase / dehydrase and lipid transport
MLESADMKERCEGERLAASSGLLSRRRVVENAIEIEAGPEAVFDYCTDVLREPEWNPKLLEVEKLTAGPIRLGTRFRIRLDGVGWSTTENIVFHRPSFCAATSASKLLDVRIEWEVTPAGHGARLSVRTLLLPHGVLRLAHPILRPYLWRQWEHHLRRIKSRLELPG